MGGNPVSGIDPDGRQSHRLSDAQANLQQAQGEMAAVDNTSVGGGGGLPWYAMIQSDLAEMKLQYGTQVSFTHTTVYSDGKAYSSWGSQVSIQNYIESQDPVCQKILNQPGFGRFPSLETGEDNKGKTFGAASISVVGQKAHSFFKDYFWYGEHQDDNNPQYTAFRDGGNTAANLALTLTPIGELGNLFRFGKLAQTLTTSEGFLIGSIGIKMPFNLTVGLYASEKTTENGIFKWSTIAPEVFGGTEWFGRRMLQITPEMQSSLGVWSSQTIERGTQIRIGFVGPQSGQPIGSWFQFYSQNGINFIK
jgi:hypothetical protein